MPDRTSLPNSAIAFYAFLAIVAASTVVHAAFLWFFGRPAAPITMDPFTARVAVLGAFFGAVMGVGFALPASIVLWIVLRQVRPDAPPESLTPEESRSQGSLSRPAAGYGDAIRQPQDGMIDRSGR